MNQLADAGRPASKINFTQALRIWWATTWRYVVITLFAGMGFTLLHGLVGTFLGRDPLTVVQGNDLAVSAFATVVSTVVMMFAMRQALLADYHSFSLTVVEAGSEEPGRIHRALGAGRMVRIWWAAAWPLHLVGQGVNHLALRFGERFGWASGVEEFHQLGCAALGAVLVAQFGLSVACLWRAVRKGYRGFRLGVLEPWGLRQGEPGVGVQD